jgi:hypothetical protein
MTPGLVHRELEDGARVGLLALDEGEDPQGLPFLVLLLLLGRRRCGRGEVGRLLVVDDGRGSGLAVDVYLIALVDDGGAKIVVHRRGGGPAEPGRQGGPGRPAPDARGVPANRPPRSGVGAPPGRVEGAVVVEPAANSGPACGQYPSGVRRRVMPRGHVAARARDAGDVAKASVGRQGRMAVADANSAAAIACRLAAAITGHRAAPIAGSLAAARDVNLAATRSRNGGVPRSGNLATAIATRGVAAPVAAGGTTATAAASPGEDRGRAGQDERDGQQSMDGCAIHGHLPSLSGLHACDLDERCIRQANVIHAALQ